MTDRLSDLVRDYELDLRSSGRALNTRRMYAISLAAFLAYAGENATLEALTRSAIRAWLGQQAGVVAPGTVKIRFGNMRSFCNWLVSEQVLDASPMAGMRAPAVPPVPVDPYPEEEVQRLLTVCGARDKAIVMLFMCTGMRRAELAGIKLEDVDFDQQLLLVMGKGSKPRIIPFDDATSLALRRWLRVRRDLLHADSPALFIGQRGGLSGHSVDQMLRARAKEAGLTGVRAHRFRNTFADKWLSEGGGEQSLMAIAGWSSPNMLGRYTAARKVERALADYKRLTFTKSETAGVRKVKRRHLPPR